MIDDRLLRLLNAFHGARVLVLGDVMADRFVYGSVRRISPEAPVPVMGIERTKDMAGGAANVARNVAALGAQAVLIGVVGADSWAECLGAQLAAVPTIRAQLLVDASRPTTAKTRHIADHQQILRTDVESLEPLSPEMAAAVMAAYREALAQVDIVVLSDYGKGVISEALAAAALAAARRAGKPVLVDPKHRSFAKYRGATLLTPNLSELRLACGRDCTTDEQIAEAAREVLEADICSAMLVTRGKDGISIVPDNGPATHLRAFAHDAHDVSGAGDTVVAALALGLAAGGEIADAARLANVAAGIVVGKHGTATVTTGEIVARLDDAAAAYPGKYFTLEAARDLVMRWRELGLRIAFTNGCFDLLHLGHVSLLTEARQAADRLIVGLNSDLSVRRLKGPGRPVQDEVARATILASLKFVDAVVVFGDETPLRLIEALDPDVLVKGADYSLDAVVGADIVLQRGGRVVLAQLLPEHSTTGTIQRIAAGRP